MSEDRPGLLDGSSQDAGRSEPRATPQVGPEDGPGGPRPGESNLTRESSGASPELPGVKIRLPGYNLRIGPTGRLLQAGDQIEFDYRGTTYTATLGESIPTGEHDLQQFHVHITDCRACVAVEPRDVVQS